MAGLLEAERIAGNLRRRRQGAAGQKKVSKETGKERGVTRPGPLNVEPV